MTTPLRAFLLIHTDGAWRVTVHRDFEDVTSEWAKFKDASDRVGILHVGFSRPPSKEFDPLIEVAKCRLLLSASAKYSLPAGYLVSERSVGVVSDMPIYVGLKGWGYEVSESDAKDLSIGIKSNHAEAQYSGWVKEFIRNFPEATNRLRDAEIVDEGSYSRAESTLDVDLRKELGLFRLTELLKPVMGSPLDPCDFARASPPWFLAREFDTIDLPVRVVNAFSAVGIKKVEDLTGWNREMLFEVRNFGRKSVNDLLVALQDAIDEGPLAGIGFSTILLARNARSATVGDDATTNSDLQSRTLLGSIDDTLGRMESRTREIVARRMGLGFPQETLQELGARFDVTRERIRQIEAKAVDRLIKREVWDDELTARLSDLIVDRTMPLPLRGLDAVDPWFAGMGKEGEALAYLLQNVSSGPAKIVQIDGASYIGSISQGEWDEAVHDAKQMMAGGVARHWSIEHCKTIVGGLLPERCREFRDLLWESISQQAHFVDEGEVKILSGFGRGAENYVFAVLASSDAPLHYSTIADRVNERYNSAQDPRTLHNAAANVGLLFGRGIYGLDRHIPLSEQELRRLGDDAYEIMVEGPEGRQWHASELVSELLERHEIQVEKVDKYLLDIALHRVEGIHHLGRFVWTLSDRAHGSDSFRIDIRQAIAFVLEEAGGPLPAEEIRLRVSESRGLNGKFQIYPVDPIVRIGHGVWGLNDRDLPVRRSDQPRFHDILVSLLRSRGIGIHATELLNFKSLAASGLNTVQIVSVAVLDERIVFSTGRYVFLREWGSPRRESVRDALAFILLNSGGPLTTSQITAQVDQRLGRAIEHSAVVSQLESLATYETASETWKINRSDSADGIDDLT